MIKIFDAEFELDFFDADELEVYERENQRVVDRMNDSAKFEGKSTADALRLQCRIVDDFFDALFGAGTAERLFQGKANILKHMEAFGIVADAAMNCRKELDAIEAKYDPKRRGVGLTGVSITRDHKQKKSYKQGKPYKQ